MNNIIDKEKIVKSINEKINYLSNEKEDLKASELKELLYVINKGCFDKVYNTNTIIELDEYIKQNSWIWDLTDVKEFLLDHKDNIIEILQRL